MSSLGVPQNPSLVSVPRTRVEALPRQRIRRALLEVGVCMRERACAHMCTGCWGGKERSESP